jgi:hypothetical protein
MLIIDFYVDENTLTRDNFFDFEYAPEWLETDFAKRAVKEIDKSDLIGPNLIQSPILGPIPPAMLSGGVKAVIMAREQPGLRKYSSILFGDNCLRLLLEAAEDRDITIVFENWLTFPDDLDWKIYFVNIDKYVKTNEDFITVIFDHAPEHWGGDFDRKKINVKSRFSDLDE